MSIVNCTTCAKPIDTDYNVDDLIDTTCIDCVEEMATVELMDFKDSLSSSYDKEYVEEVLKEREDESN